SCSSSMGPARSSGGIMHRSAFQPHSAIVATAISIPALIYAASKPGGMAGSEKSTVSGSWPTKSMRVMSLPPSVTDHNQVIGPDQPDDEHRSRASVTPPRVRPHALYCRDWSKRCMTPYVVHLAGYVCSLPAMRCAIRLSH